MQAAWGFIRGDTSRFAVSAQPKLQHCRAHAPHSQPGVGVQRLIQALRPKRIVVHILQLLGQAHKELVDVCGQAGMKAGRQASRVCAECALKGAMIPCPPVCAA